MEENKSTAIYIRVSTEDQAKDGFSINAQKEKLTKYAEANDWIIYDYYIDDGISGKNIDGRPEVKRMLNDVKKGKINNILIYKLDRLTRSVRDLMDLIELFERHNCTFNSQTEKIDTSNAVGRMFVKIIGIFAEFERENLAERVSFGYEQKTREGNYTNTNGVYGYDYIVGEQRLIVNEEEKELVNRIYDMYIEGLSYFKIARKLNLERIPTKRGGTWAPGTIKSILSNPLYIGKVRYGLENKNKDKSFIVEGNNIESIIDFEKWEQAQKIVTVRKHFNTRRYPSENSYFFHTIRCAKCGGSIVARQQIQHGKLYITYKCTHSMNLACDCSGFSHTKMEKVFIEYLEYVENLTPSKDIMKINKDKNDSEKIIKALSEKLEKMKIKKERIKTDFIKDVISIDEYHAFNEEVDIELKNISEKLDKLEFIEEKTKDEYTFDEIKDIVSNIKINWMYLNNKEKQQFLERFIEVMEVEKFVDSPIKIKNVKFK